MERDKQLELLTGGPSSGGMIILLFPPGLMSRIPSSNPVCEFFNSVILTFFMFLEYAENGKIIHRLSLSTWNQCISAHANPGRRTLQVGAINPPA